MSKEAMKLALEALGEILESFEKDGKVCMSSLIRNELFDRLKETLDKCKAIVEAEKQEQGEPVAWNDRKDEWTDEIAAHHPLKTKAYTQWDTAMAMVGARHSKSALVELVCWLLQKSTPQQRTWVGLTDEEVKDVWGACSSAESLIKGTEAKLKEKNNA